MRRHPLEVTADRLSDHWERYYDQMSGSDRDNISQVIALFDRIVDEGAGT